MAINPDTDRLDAAEYARRIKAGDEILFLKEAAKFVRKPDATLRYWRHLGIGPRSFRHGRNVAYWTTDLILWMAEEAGQPHGVYDRAHSDARPQVRRRPN